MASRTRNASGRVGRSNHALPVSPVSFAVVRADLRALRSVVAIHGHPHRRVAPPWRNTDPLRSSAAPPQALCRSSEKEYRSSVEENRSLAERSYSSPGAAQLLGGARLILRGGTLPLGGAMFVLRGAAQVLRGGGLLPRWSSTGPRCSSLGPKRRKREREPATRGSHTKEMNLIPIPFPLLRSGFDKARAHRTRFDRRQPRLRSPCSGKWELEAMLFDLLSRHQTSRNTPVDSERSIFRTG